MIGNVAVDAENIKETNTKSKEKMDGVVTVIMSLDREQ